MITYYYSCIDESITPFLKCLTLDEWFIEYKKVYRKSFKGSDVDFVFEFEKWAFDFLLVRYSK